MLVSRREFGVVLASPMFFRRRRQLPAGAVANYNFASVVSGNRIVNAITGGDALPDLIIDDQAPDFEVIDGAVRWNENIPNPIFVFPPDDSRGSFARTETSFPNIAQSGTYGIRLKATSEQLGPLGVASSIAILTWRESPDPNDAEYPAKHVSYYQDGDGTLFIYAEDGEPLGCPTGCQQRDKVQTGDLGHPFGIEYHNVIVTWTPTTMAMYINGSVVQALSSRIAEDFNADNYHLFLAWQSSLIHSGDNPWLMGYTQKLIIYNRALNSSEVTDLNAVMSESAGSVANRLLRVPGLRIR